STSSAASSKSKPVAGSGEDGGSPTGSTAAHEQPLRRKRRGRVPNSIEPEPTPGTSTTPGPSPTSAKWTLRSARSTVGISGGSPLGEHVLALDQRQRREHHFADALQARRRQVRDGVGRLVPVRVVDQVDQVDRGNADVEERPVVVAAGLGAAEELRLVAT